MKKLQHQILKSKLPALAAILLVCAACLSACINIPLQHAEVKQIPAVNALVRSPLQKHEEIPKDAYFINQMESSQKALCTTIYNGIMNFESEISFTQPVHEGELKKLMWLLSYDCPELFQFSGEYAYYVRENEKENVLSIQPHYLMTQAEYKDALSMIKELISKWLNEAASMDDYAKEKLLYDKLIESCTYDEDGLYSGTAYGALIEGKARCEGYSKALCLALRTANIETMVVTGTAWGNQEYPSAQQAHAWNVVNIDGSYYHLDVTWDDNNEFGTCYAYFNVTDDVMSQSRKLDDVYSVFRLPEATETMHNYYVRAGLFIYDGEDVSRIFHDALESAYTKNTQSIFFRFETDSQTKLFSENFEKWMGEWFLQKRLSKGAYTYSVYSHSRVFCILNIAYNANA